MKPPIRFTPPVRAGLCAAYFALFALGCAAPQKNPPAAPKKPTHADTYAAAFDAEAADSSSALPYLDAIDKAIAEPDSKGALATVIASVDALAFGATPNLDLVREHALAYRSRELLPVVVARLRRAWFSAGEYPKARQMPFMRGFIAHALHRLALFTGDEQPASVWMRRRACVNEATLIGPLDAMPLLGISKPSPIAKPGTPLFHSYPGIAPFASNIAPLPIGADTCMLDINAAHLLQGSRALVIDIQNPRAQRLSFALSSPASAALDVGGARIIERGYDAGGSFVTKLAQAEVAQGKVRALIYVGYKNDGDQVELDVWDEDGLSLEVRAPRPGEKADAAVRSFDELNFGGHPIHGLKGRSENDLALHAAALLALGDARPAEHLLEPKDADKAGTPSRSPRLELLYARAIENAQDMPETKALERTREAIAKVREAWPASWEARIMAARMAERRRGAGDGVIVALKSLGIQPIPDDAQGIDPAFLALDRMSLSYAALLSRRARLIDIAENAYAALEQAAPGSSLLAAVDARLHARTGPELVKAACLGGTSRADTDCLEAHLARNVPSAQAGDFKAAMSEIIRLRRLKNSTGALRELEVGLKLSNGDFEGALAAHALLPPARRRLLDIYGYSLSKEPAANPLRRWNDSGNQTNNAADMPYSLPPLYRALGLVPDPAPALESEGRRLVLADQKEAFMPGAATAVLRHTEHYKIEASGLVYYLSYDLRRVSGTTDVAQGAMSFGPMIEGRNASRILRRRIHKRDGRMLEPDAAANAMQWSDLSQLEQGDYVEQILEGYSLPGDSGQLVLDTPDLLPERTSVRSAEIEVKYASGLRFSRWSHPLLGRAEEQSEGEFKVLTWRLIDALPRRIEDGVPRMERAVAISLGTQNWEQIGRAMDENVRSLEDRDPFVRRFAEQIAEQAKADSSAAQNADPKALIDKVVTTVGKRIKVAGGAELSDVSAAYGGGSQRTTARTMLELGQGSRSWVIYRLLSELNVPVDLAIAETEPFSASPDFPPHVGRFTRPLLVAHLGEGQGGDVWIDADVEGPPLPAGRISPELRGRSAMLKGGKIVTVEGTSGEKGDEVDLTLSLDEKGNAQGSLTLKIHGRAAQSLADALDVIVGTERRQMLQSVVLGWLPWADVEDVALSSGEGSWEVEIRAKVRIDGYARPYGQDAATWILPGIEAVHFMFPRAFSGTLGATYASRGARESALLIDSPLQYRVRRSITLPSGAQITRAPEAVRTTGKQLEASRTGKYGSLIEEEFVLSLPTGTVNADVYPVFVEQVRTVDDGFMAGIRVRAKP